jgi:hypothetical protein
VETQEHLLGRILGQFELSQQAQGSHEHLALVLNNDLPESGGFASFGPS